VINLVFLAVLVVLLFGAGEGGIFRERRRYAPFSACRKERIY